MPRDRLVAHLHYFQCIGCIEIEGTFSKKRDGQRPTIKITDLGEKVRAAFDAFETTRMGYIPAGDSGMSADWANPNTYANAMQVLSVLPVVKEMQLTLAPEGLGVKDIQQGASIHSYNVTTEALQLLADLKILGKKIITGRRSRRYTYFLKPKATPLRDAEADFSKWFEKLPTVEMQ